MKRDKYDALFSKIIRERDNWTCQRCGKYYPEGNRQGIHCSHIFSRRHTATRWEPLNAVAHCFSCHQYLGGNPVIFDRWVRRYYNDAIVEMLEEKAMSVCKLTKKDKAELYEHMKSEYDRMMKLRRDGDTSQIRIVGYV